MSNKQTIDPSASGEATGMHAAAESPVLIHIWEVDPEQEGVAAQRLDKMLGEIAAEPGFVSARVLESADRRSIAAVVEMRTVEDRQRLEQVPVVRDTLHHLDGTMNIIVRLYHQVGTYRA
jgi:hypothetical protein